MKLNVVGVEAGRIKFVGILICIAMLLCINSLNVMGKPDTSITNCSILSTEGETYLVTANVYAANTTCISVTGKNITLDCQGHEIRGINTTGSIGVYSNLPLIMKDCKVYNWGRGIEINLNTSTVTGTLINNITSSNNLEYGIMFYHATGATTRSVFSNILLRNNGDKVAADGAGMYLAGTSYNVLSNITITNNPWGLTFTGGNYNNFTNLTLSNNNYGFRIDGFSAGNILKNSILTSNSVGIHVKSGASSNHIFNNFFNNTNNAVVDGGTPENFWNTTKQTGAVIYGNITQIGGNYYTNATITGYSDKCTDANSDGFCDVTYNLTSDGNNRDYLALIDVYADRVPPNATWISPVDEETYTTRDITIDILAADNIAVDTVWWYNGTGNVTYTSEITLTLANGDYEFMVYANDTSGNVNNIQNVTFSVGVSTATAGSSGGGVATSGPFFLRTYDLQGINLSTGYTQDLKFRERLKTNISGGIHYIGITSVTNRSITANITISVYSSPQRFVFNIGDKYKFDVNSDGYYDLSVKLNSITAETASITIQAINEDVNFFRQLEPQIEESNKSVAEQVPEVKTEIKIPWDWILRGVILVFAVLVVLFIVYKIRHRRPTMGNFS